MRCSICKHPHISEIDKALIAGVTNRAIAARFNLGRESVRRHRDSHVPLLAQQEDQLVRVAATLHARVAALKSESKIHGRVLTALAAQREIERAQKDLESLQNVPEIVLLNILKSICSRG